METNILPGATPESPVQEKIAAEESVLEIVRRLFLIVSSQRDETSLPKISTAPDSNSTTEKNAEPAWSNPA